MIFGEEKGPEVISVVSKDVFFQHGGTSGSNPLSSASESIDDRAVAPYQNGPMSYSSISLFVWSLSSTAAMILMAPQPRI